MKVCLTNLSRLTPRACLHVKARTPAMRQTMSKLSTASSTARPVAGRLAMSSRKEGEKACSAARKSQKLTTW
jgi:hypothetical protein